MDCVIGIRVRPRRGIPQGPTPWGCNLDIKNGARGKTKKPSSPEVAMPSFTS